ncbi:hypothetical protein FJY68_09150 [candidate division WOR-3 bacterium]|uniref:YfhO family protein n=1 Tax=candidate division WOR-3 bacterium TaxID=2052148 RepID=A0A937XGI0_UNCW3|nr:hypothetical protein [candidate division WOR-3 bacterium]
MPKKHIPPPARTQAAKSAGPSDLDRLAGWPVILALLLIPFLFYGKYLFGGRMLDGTDWLGAGSYIMREFMATYIRSHGNVALWWPAVLCGQQTVAGFFADMFYPTLLLRLILPVHVVWTWTFVLHHFLAGLGTYLFLKELKVSTIAAGLGGIGYQLAGSLVTLAYAGHDGRLIGSALLPLALFFLHRGMSRSQFRWFVFSGFIVAMQLLSGHIQKVYYTGLVLTAYFVFTLVGTVRRERSKTVALKLCGYFLALFLFAGALSSIQYLPVYGNLPFASRGSERGYAYATSWSMPIIETFDLLTPKFSGGLDAYWSRNPFKLHSEYLGIIPLLFACVAVFRRWKDRYTKFFTFSFLGALVLAWGGYTPLYYIPYYLFPGISKFRGPAMIFFVAAFSLVVLAGLGIDHFLREAREGDSRKTTRTVLAFGAVPLVLLLLFAALKGPMLSLLQSTTSPSQQKLEALAANYPAILGGLFFSLVFTALGVLLVRLFMNRKLKPVVFASGLAAIMVCDIGLSLSLWDESRGYIKGAAPPTEYFAPDEAVAFLKQDTSLHRVLPWQYERSDDGILAYNHIQSVAGQLPNPLQVYMDFLGVGTSVFFRPDYLLSPNAMNLANIKYVISLTLPDDVSGYDQRTQQMIGQIRGYFSDPRFELAFAGQKYSVYRNRSVLPRAYVAAGYEQVKSKEEVLSRLRMPDFDPSRTVLLYANPGLAATAGTTAGTADVTAYDCNAITVKADLAEPGLLVLSESYHPDWKAYDNGKPAPVQQAYHAFRAVALGPGQHEVVFRYESRWYRLGSYLSGAALLFLVATLGGVFIVRRKPRPSGV